MFMKNRPYQRCTRCVMDTTDSKITFDENGVCDHCRNFDKNIAPFWKPSENRFDELEELTKKIRKAGRNSEYDCILGLSGGADSSEVKRALSESRGIYDRSGADAVQRNSGSEKGVSGGDGLRLRKCDDHSGQLALGKSRSAL